MIDYIKYTIDGVTYSLNNNGDNTWSRKETAPSVAGNYLLTLIISENGIVTTINSSNSMYETYLNVIMEAERVACLEKFVPDFISETKQFKTIFDIEDENFDNLYFQIENIKSDAFITTASNDAIVRLENFMSIKGLGTLDQRKSYLISMLQKGNKLSEMLRDKINEIFNKTKKQEKTWMKPEKYNSYSRRVDSMFYFL